MAIDIVLSYSRPFAGDAPYRAIFEQAVLRWEQAIAGYASGAVAGSNDVAISIGLYNIDGAGGVLAEAGPTGFKNSGGLPHRGDVRFDIKDAPGQLADGTLLSTAIHEIGHVLGLGTVWDDFGLVNGFSYVGARALAEYRLMSGDLSATAIPLEAYGGDGTAGGHWRESTFAAELMTGFSEDAGTPEPLSRLTLAALEDLGYVVNYGAADAFLLPPPPPTAAPLSLSGRKKADDLFGGTGHDTLNGKKGDDYLYGEEGNDVLLCGKGSDYADGGFGNDQIFGGKGSDRLFGDFGADFIDGGKGNDTVSGEDGNDTLLGAKGSDFVDGGTGDDYMSGGKGSDTFHFGPAFGIDTIADFSPGKDTIEIDLVGYTSFNQLRGLMSQTAAGAKIDFGADEIIFQNIAFTSLDSGDFIFI
jgi:Ca2+-binding RTX toxin-like protein